MLFNLFYVKGILHTVMPFSRVNSKLCESQVIFGGAQKNIGITDITLVIVRKDLLATVPSSSFLHAVGVWS